MSSERPNIIFITAEQQRAEHDTRLWRHVDADAESGRPGRRGCRLRQGFCPSGDLCLQSSRILHGPLSAQQWDLWLSALDRVAALAAAAVGARLPLRQHRQETSASHRF